MKIEIKGLDALAEKLDRIGQKTLRLATAAAIKDTAFQVREGLQREMKTVFDRPTPWAIDTVRVDVSRKLTAVIGMTWSRTNTESSWKTPHFAGPNVYGGSRGYKRIERFLRSAGILPQGMYVAPAKTAWLDKYGNISGQEIQQVLRSVGAMGERARIQTAEGKKRTKAQNRYFVMKRAGRPIGIAERIWGANNIRMLLVFISKPTYQRKFKFHEVGHRIALQNFNKNFKDRWKEYQSYNIK